MLDPDPAREGCGIDKNLKAETAGGDRRRTGPNILVKAPQSVQFVEMDGFGSYQAGFAIHRSAARDDCRAAPKSARCANDNEDCAKEDATVDAAVAVEEGLAAGGTGVCRCDDDGGGRRSGRRWSSPLLRSPPPPPPPSSSSSSL